MRIKIRAKVPGEYHKIMAAFDLKLFKALAPPVGNMEILKFTGSEKGDVVHIRFNWPLKIDWISDITEHGDNGEEAYFVDQGRVLPPGLSHWHHRHIVRKCDSKSSFIIDDIQYRGSNFILTILLYPVLYLSFYPRKFIYKKYFSNLEQNK